MLPDIAANDKFTAEQTARMKARESELTARMEEEEQGWKDFVASASDEEIVRAFLASRVVLWQQLPYHWMDMDAEFLDSWNIIDYPPEVEAAYRRSRADAWQRAMFEKDYGRGHDITKNWLDGLQNN